MTFDVDPSRDYVVATFLPYTRQRHDTQLEQVREFTTDEARQLYMDGLPLIMNHHDGSVDPTTGDVAEHHPVGVIHASSVRGTDAKMLASIDPTMNEAAMLSSNKVALSEYGAVSLGQLVETRIKSGEGGYAVFVKRPIEVSLCRRGRRHGSSIEQYCPGRATLERLAQHEPDDLERMIDAHDYRRELIDSGVDDKKSARYIDVLATLSRNRLVRAIDADSLYPRPPPRQTTPANASMSDSKQDQASADMKETVADATTTTDASTETAATKMADAAQVPATSSGVETPANSEMSALKEMTDRALKSKHELVERTKKMAEMEQRLAKAEEAEKKLAAIEQEKHDRIKSEFETALKSLEQYELWRTLLVAILTRLSGYRARRNAMRATARSPTHSLAATVRRRGEDSAQGPRDASRSGQGVVRRPPEPLAQHAQVGARHGSQGVELDARRRGIESHAHGRGREGSGFALF